MAHAARRLDNGPALGGKKIPEAVKRDTVTRVERHATAVYAGFYTRLDIRFRGALCYLDAYLGSAGMGRLVDRSPSRCQKRKVHPARNSA